MQKIFAITFFSLFLFLVASPVLAGGTNCPTGLVPCGGVESCPCELCDIFVMIDRILDLVIIKIVPAIAVLMLIVGGIMFMFALFGGAELLPGGAKGEPKTLNQAKKIITSTIIGLVIIFGSFLIVGAILSAIGLAGWTQDFYSNWWQEGFFQIPCN